MRQKIEPMEKNCVACGGRMIQPRWKNGKLDSTFKSRKFCSAKCYGNFNTLENCSENAGRRRAQRLYPMIACQDCGQKSKIQRHHVDGNPLNNSLENIRILCQSCHTSEHKRIGTWGRGNVPPAICKICGKEFQPERRREKGRRICGRKMCLRKMGKFSAALRWGSKTE